ncbi:PPE domain-containing protein [Mycobacterium sp. 1245852.3]|uniref:PPE domain-containing protein n=1 Tax=Mycobacterium sp. 1245852.3 TaxID=1856860 RepID=UPI0007FBC262|nr:PPE domain-containing protein [Mycobacterium sp. 1245852.3]OBJ84185.1 hypothetical protein A9W96_27250 [Mycobacterium sp. 1245852.3]
MGLDIDTSGLRHAGELVHAAGEALHQQLESDVPPCGDDEVSKALMDNLNAWQRWLVQHIKAGAQQAFSAAAGIHSTASGFDTQDTAAAAAYGGAGGHAPAATPAAAHSGPGAAGAAPAGPPATSPVPDISGRDGEKLALALHSGAGPAPALAKAAQWEGVATQAVTAHTALTGARTQLLASGHAAMSSPLLTRLDRAIGWTQQVATHASALANGYSTAAGAHTTATTAVGHPTVWRTTKTNLAEARADPFGAPRAQAYQTQLTGMQHTARVTLTGYTTTGKAAGTPPGTLPPGPGLAPNTPNAPGSPTPNTGDKPGQTDQQDDPPTPKSGDGSPQTSKSSASGEGSGFQDMLGSLMGALGPLMQSFGQGNPLQSLGQLGQQLSQQAGNLAKATKPPIKPAALTHAHPAGGGAHKGGGGGSPIKPAPLGGVHSAGLTGTPASSPPTGPSKAAASPAAASSSGSGGMGMMPMGRHGEGTESKKVHSYEQPIPEVDSEGRPGVVGAAEKAEPVVKPDAHNAVKARIAARKKETSTRGDT